MKRAIAIAIGLLLGACSPVGDSIRDTGGGAIVIGSGSGVASGSAEAPMAPPVFNAETQNTAANPTYKNAATIGVEKQGHCSKLEQHLQKQGLDVTLVEITVEGNRNDGRQLHYGCHFEGEDCGNFDVNNNVISTRITWVNPLRVTGRLR
ncbi:hypothetical protein H6G00_01375 [Leptolyngbya sp. FACHB-541]|uniref:hypothetical protein n=1 Tax=Leptolyngbya sp. FACHB-541 TaxID=2692810 RepID=UPI0016852AFF|nr:hypothetical protein [Leptolyngbya sp. FACHB-541]MBD1995280.1 hypothetical protein [Leptolyngbya sp. FACHB-541]